MIIPLPMMPAPLIVQSSSFVAWVLLLSLKQRGMTYLPSNTGIALRLVFAAIWICSTFFVLREIEA